MLTKANRFKALNYGIVRGISVSKKQTWMLHPTMPQDFSGQNLRGRSFKGQNLAGANFSYADIRGANFTGANLRGANFSHAKAGLQKHWIVSLILLTLLLIGLVGFITAFNFRRAEEYYLSFESIQRHTILPGVIMQILALHNENMN